MTGASLLILKPWSPLIQLLGQLIVPPVIAVLILRLGFTTWWEAVGMRTRWSVWILLSAGLLLFFQYLWPMVERRLRQQRAAKSSS